MGTRNTLLDLNDHLFMQIERLNDDELSGDDLEKELKRSKAMSQIASQVVGVANIVLEATKFNSDYDSMGKAPRLLIGDSKEVQP
jgi:hypothetical protein